VRDPESLELAIGRVREAELVSALPVCEPQLLLLRLLRGLGFRFWGSLKLTQMSHLGGLVKGHLSRQSQSHGWRESQCLGVRLQGAWRELTPQRRNMAPTGCVVCPPHHPP